jgi:hypothetical protein
MEIDIPDLDDVEFEVRCRYCMEGKIRPRVYKSSNGLTLGEAVDCAECGGTGRLITPVGRRLIEFLRHRGVACA